MKKLTNIQKIKLIELMDSSNWDDPSHYEDNNFEINDLDVVELVEEILNSDIENAIQEMNELEDWLRQWTRFKDDYRDLDEAHLNYIYEQYLQIIKKYNIKEK